MYCSATYIPEVWLDRASPMVVICPTHGMSLSRLSLIRVCPPLIPYWLYSFCLSPRSATSLVSPPFSYLSPKGIKPVAIGMGQGHDGILQGGIRLEVLNADDQPIALFADFSEPFNVSETSRRVELPNKFECANCAIRLTQSMGEFKKGAAFVSCADVNILNGRERRNRLNMHTAIPNGDSCMGRGERTNGQCSCQKGYTGEQCEETVECMKHSECGESGECRTANGTPHKQCYCPIGTFGENCQFGE